MRILVADGQSRVRFALRVLLEQQPGLELVGEVVCAADLLAQAEATNPDLLLLGWELPGLAPVDSLAALRETCPDLSVIALSGRSEARQAALDAGADAFVSKTDPPERLLVAIGDCECKRRGTESDKPGQERVNTPDLNQDPQATHQEQKEEEIQR